jgi:hypothetical protein
VRCSAHGDIGRSIGTFFLRAALPALGAVIGAASADCHGVEQPCGLRQIGTGFLLGAAAASVVDIALLSGPSSQRPPSEQPPSRARPGWTLAPSFAASSTLALVGVGGQF